MTMRLPATLLLQRIEAKTEFIPATGCHVFTGGRDSNGYGQIHVGGGKRGIKRGVHRVAYEILVGPVPAGKELDHKCRVRQCWNPVHLEPVTHLVNLLRAPVPGSRYGAVTACLRGHPFDEANTRIVRNARTRRGWWRQCRLCNAARARPYLARKRATA